MNTKIFKLLAVVLISIIVITGCEQEFDNTIDNFNYNYQVVSVSPSDPIYFDSTDSLITVSIKFSSGSTIQTVFCDIYASDDTKLSTVTLYDDGNSSKGDSTKNDMIYSNKLPLSRVYPNGVYNIKYFVTDELNEIKQVAIGTFTYNNGQNNVAPILNNLILADSVKRNVQITFSVNASDENGLSDIVKVYYELYQPNGSKITNSNGVSQFPLFDDGNVETNGDLTANDGKYTVKLTFPVSVASGLWRFEFQAKDRAGALSEKITKSVKVL
ncbi:MAG: hypothetical protein WAV89_11445 [Ignavibacteriaceae bacterium]